MLSFTLNLSYSLSYSLLLSYALTLYHALTIWVLGLGGSVSLQWLRLALRVDSPHTEHVVLALDQARHLSLRGLQQQGDIRNMDKLT